MQPRTIIVMGLAIVCGGLAAFMTSRIITENNGSVTVIVAKQRIAPWTVLKSPQDMFEPRMIKKSEAPENALLNIGEIQDRTMFKTLEAGLVMTEDHLLPKNMEGFDAHIPRGFQTDSVAVTADKVSGGFVQAGMRVDVIHTGRGSGDGHGEPRMILSNIQVIATDLSPAPAEGSRPSAVPGTVTLVLKPEQVLILEKAKMSGVIALALRSRGDNRGGEKEKLVDTAVQTTLVTGKAPEKVVQLIHNGQSWVKTVYTVRDGIVMSADVQRSVGDAPPPTPLPPLEQRRLQTQPDHGPTGTNLPPGLREKSVLGG